MESALTPYWSKSENIPSALNSTGSFESQIFEKHKEIISQASSIPVHAVNTAIRHIVNGISKANAGYSRVSCGENTCEVVLAFPNTPGDSEKAKSIINSFYDKILVKNTFYKVAGPSMIIDGPNGRNGFTMLFYVNTK